MIKKTDATPASLDEVAKAAEPKAKTRAKTTAKPASKPKPAPKPPASDPIHHSRSPGAPRLQQLAATFGLSPFDSHILAALWMATFDHPLRQQLMALEPWHGCITVRAVAKFFHHPEQARLASQSPLRLWHMVQEQALLDGSASLVLDPHILAWLEGHSEIDRILIGQVQILKEGIELASWPLDNWATMLAQGLQHGTRWRVVLQSAQPDLQGELTCVAALGQRLGLSVLCLNLPASNDGQAANSDSASPAELVKRLHRMAFLDAALPCIIQNSNQAVELGRECQPFPLEFHINGASNPGLGALPRRDQQPLQLTLPVLSNSDRQTLWQAVLPAAKQWNATELQKLSLDSDANVSEILNSAASKPGDARQAAAQIELRYRDQLQGLAQRINASYQWDDLVLPPGLYERLRDIEFEARERHLLWAEPEIARLYPQGRGLVALFSGPPGTGKTMAAQVIAAQLGLDLLRVDLSAVVSKWVGETAQNLQKILSARVARRAVLFFDEADALYGKRVEDTRDAQDRYANMDISHLMVALEQFDGIVLLASNLKGNIDPAFLRRIRHSIEFTRPDQAARAAIWQRVVAAVFPAQKGIAVDALAMLEATGAQIKQAALSSAFQARRLKQTPDTTLLATMLARELGKDGAGLSRSELAAILGHETGGVF